MAETENKALVAAPTGVPDSLREFYLTLSEEDRAAIAWMDADMVGLQLQILKDMTTSGSVEGVAKEIAKEFHESIIQSVTTIPEQPSLFLHAGLPTELSRTSPFFVLGPKALKNRERIENMEIVRHAWGSISFSGLKLSVSDEDTLMVVLAMLNSHNNRAETEVGGRKTYMYRGSMLTLLKARGIDRPGSSSYKDMLESLKRLASAQFTLVTNRKNAQGAPAPKTTFISGIISGLSYDSANHELILAINPFFFESFNAGFVTFYDVAARLDLNSQYAKALYRFMTSHRDDEWRGHYTVLVSALNLDANQPATKIRQNLNAAIKELVQKGHMTKRSGIVKDVAHLERTPSKQLQTVNKKTIPLKQTK
jgi:hypothetical protein